MSDNIKSFGGALLRQAQMKEWKAIPEAERPTWEQFKRGLKRKKKWDLLLTFPEILIFFFLLWGFMLNTSLRSSPPLVGLSLFAGSLRAMRVLRLLSLVPVRPSPLSSARSPRVTCPTPHTIGRSCGRIPKKTDFFRWLFFWFCYSFFCYGND